MATHGNRESAQKLGDKVVSSGKETLEELRAKVRERFKENPVLYTGVAATAGFLVGGGLLSGTTLRLLRRSLILALQLTVVPVLLDRMREAIVEQMP